MLNPLEFLQKITIVANRWLVGLARHPSTQACVDGSRRVSVGLICEVEMPRGLSFSCPFDFARSHAAFRVSSEIPKQTNSLPPTPMFPRLANHNTEAPRRVVAIAEREPEFPTALILQLIELAKVHIYSLSEANIECLISDFRGVYFPPLARRFPLPKRLVDGVAVQP